MCAFWADDWGVEVVRLHGSGWSRWLAGRVSYWGDWYGVAALGVAFWGWGHWSSSLDVRRLALIMGLSAAVAGMGANIVRATTGRARPNAEVASGWYGPAKGLRVWTRGARDFQSFPSAHTAVVAGFFAPLALVAFRSRRRARRWGGMSLALFGTGLMAWARVWAGAHHLSDVAVASLLGLGVGGLVISRVRRLPHK